MSATINIVLLCAASAVENRLSKNTAKIEEVAQFPTKYHQFTEQQIIARHPIYNIQCASRQKELLLQLLYVCVDGDENNTTCFAKEMPKWCAFVLTSAGLRG